AVEEWRGSGGGGPAVADQVARGLGGQAQVGLDHAVLGEAPGRVLLGPAGVMITSCPGCQSAGVASWWAAVSWSESSTRRISPKCRPVLAGEGIERFIVLSGT